MRIAWKETESRLVQDIYYHDKLIGSVKKQWAAEKWKVSPNFSIIASFSSELDSIHDSAYKAGHALVEIYEREIFYEQVEHDDPFDIDDDSTWDARVTQPIDMRKMWSKP